MTADVSQELTSSVVKAVQPMKVEWKLSIADVFHELTSSVVKDEQFSKVY